MNDSSTRLFSIIFALSVVGGSWLLFEYSQAPQKRPDDLPGTVLPSSQTPQLPAVRQAKPVQRQPSDIALTYQCKGATGTVYRDHPCKPNEKEVRVSASQIVESRPDEIASLKEKAANFQQARLASAATAIQPVATNKNLTAACEDNWNSIRAVDAATRINSTEWLKNERKRLQDIRWNLKC